MDLSDITARLHQHAQKATYGAVAGLVRRLPRSVMQGLPKVPRNSWVVAKKSGLPTGYSATQIDPRLRPEEPAIDTPEQLMAWLRVHP